MTKPEQAPAELPDLPDDVDLLEVPAEPEPGSAAPAAAPLAEGERPPLRELDKAPAHLRTAALVVLVGCLVPFMGSGGGVLTLVVAKLVVLLGAWLWLKQVQHDYGPKLPGLLGKLADLRLIPEKKQDEDDGKKKRRKAQVETTASPHAHPPTALSALSLLVTFGVGCVLIPFALDPTEGLKPGVAAAELGMLAWAALTWVHIQCYERWGHFNPLFPLMFLGILFAGISRVVVGIGIGFGELRGALAVVGGVIVALGGGLAAYTIVEAMMQAKKEGDEKKRAAAEARKAARRSRASTSRP